MGAIKVLIGLWLLSILSANASSIPAVQSVRVTDEQSDYNQDSNESKAYIKDRWGTRGYSAKSDSEKLDESSSSLVSDATGTTKTANARGFANEAESLNTFSVSADGRQKSKFASERAASEAYDKKKFEYVGADGTVVKNEESDESESSSTSTSSTTVVESPPAEVPPDHKGHHQKVWVNVDVPDVAGSGETDWSVEEKFETLENGVPCVLMKFVAKKPKKSTVISSSSSSSHNAHHSSKSSTSITPGSPNVGSGGPRYLGPPVVAPRDSGTVAVPACNFRGE
nr:uncharacterized protein LOC126054407 [Helicoverpa armigera]